MAVDCHRGVDRGWWPAVVAAQASQVIELIRSHGCLPTPEAYGSYDQGPSPLVASPAPPMCPACVASAAPALLYNRAYPDDVFV